MDPKSAKVLPGSSRRTCRKRKANHVGQSQEEMDHQSGDDGTSIWHENFPFGEFIDKHFLTEMDREAFEEWGIEKCFRVMKAAPVQQVSVVRFMEQKVGDLLKKNKACEEENTELKNKLAESENLKKELEELKLKTSQLVENEKGLMEENIKMKLKLHMKENRVNKLEAETKDLKAEIDNLKAKNEELRDEIQLQQKAGFDKAIREVIVSVCGLKP